MSEKPTLEQSADYSTYESHELDVEHEVLTPAHFRAQAEDVLSTLGTEGYEMARRCYVTEEENPRLQHLASVIVEAKEAMSLQQTLSAAQERGDQATKEALLPTVLRYNHEVRDLIDENPAGMFTREQLTNWLAEASNDRLGEWAGQFTTGIAGEIAIARRWKHHPSVTEVRFANDDEDRKGVDVVAVLKNGQTRRVDVKVGQHGLDDEVSVRQNGVTEVRLDSNMLHGFGIRQQDRDEVSMRLAQATTLGW